MPQIYIWAQREVKKISHDKRGNHQGTPTEVFNVTWRALSDICRWLGWEKSLVEQHLEFCCVMVALSCALPWPTFFLC